MCGEGGTSEGTGPGGEHQPPSQPALTALRAAGLRPAQAVTVLETHLFKGMFHWLKPRSRQWAGKREHTYITGGRLFTQKLLSCVYETKKGAGRPMITNTPPSQEGQRLLGWGGTNS